MEKHDNWEFDPISPDAPDPVDTVSEPLVPEEPILTDLCTEPEAVPIADELPATEAAPEAPAEEVPAEPEDTLWHGAGVGQQEVVTAAPAEAPVPPAAPAPEPAAAAEPRKRKKAKKSGKAGRRILAALLTIVLVAGACGVTAWSADRRWEQKMADHQSQMEQQLQLLEDQLQSLSQQQEQQEQQQSAPVIPGSSVSSADGLLPSQVYAMNVNSVVAISNQTTTNVWGQVSETASSGTGFIISADGYIISNYHVVEGATRLTVITYMGDEYEAKLVGYDEMNDVSILKIEAAGLDPVTIGSSEELIVGDQVVAIGNPLGELTSSLTVGYISAKDRTINTDGNLINMMQTDAAINPGNSGGPLFNMKGEVIGITTAKYSGSTGSGASIEGIGFAIPIDDVMAMSQDLIDHGYLTNQAYLGVTVRDLPASTASMYSLPTGSYVDSVVAGSCAEKAGIQPKDIIIGVGKYEVDGNSTLQTALRRFNAGDSTTITVYRAGQELQLPITFDERPQDPNADLQQPQQSGEMPSSGSYEDWYNFFYPYFGGIG